MGSAFRDMTDLALVPAHPRRLIFLGTPEAAVEPLRALVAAGFDVVHVVSRADRRRGRRGDATASPVKAAALELGIPVSSDVDDALDFDADLGVVVAFGKIIATPMLERLAMVNLHFSLLPRWRGAAPVERAMLAGDDTTGVCVMELAPELDTGSIYNSVEVAIPDAATAATLTAKLSRLGAAMLVESLKNGLTDPTPQAGEVTYAHKITGNDLRLDFCRSARELERIVRVGGAWTTFRGDRFKIWEADAVAADDSTKMPGHIDGQLRVATGSGSLQLVIVQAANRAPMSASDWVNGVRLTDEDCLGT